MLDIQLVGADEPPGEASVALQALRCAHRTGTRRPGTAASAFAILNRARAGCSAPREPRMASNSRSTPSRHSACALRAIRLGLRRLVRKAHVEQAYSVARWTVPCKENVASSLAL